MPNGKWRTLCRRVGYKTQCKTFKVKAQADAWGRSVESEWDRGVAGVAAVSHTVSEVIQAYRDLRDKARPILDTSNEHYMLKRLVEGLGKKVVTKLTVEDLVRFAKERQGDGAGPYTVNMDISKLGTVLRYGGAELKVVLPDVVGAARPTLSYLRLIGGGGKRDRRPTEDEFRRIVDYFTQHHGPRYTDAVRLAAITAFRRGELTEFKWTDINDETRMVSMLRKHPRKGKVLERVPLLPLAWEIVQAQPRDDDRVFPFGGSGLSKYFTKACRQLGILDLHLHDLRHEGTSALFEDGHSIEQVALVTGHKDWRNLKRYANLRPEDVHKVKLPVAADRPDSR